MVTVKKLLEVALEELGYYEKASNSQLDDKTANAGSKNYTKYARDLREAGYYNGNKNGFEWCDVFTDWCFWEACGRNKELAEKMTCQTGTLGAGVGYSARYYKNQNRFFENDPQPGDQIFFGSGDKWSHTGIVLDVTDGKVYTVEGNYKNKVAKCVYPLNHANIKGYGRPYYDTAAEVETPTAPATPVPTPVVSEMDKFVQKIANEITASGLNAAEVLKGVSEVLGLSKTQTEAPRELQKGDVVTFKKEATHYRPNGSKISENQRNNYYHVITGFTTKDGTRCALLGQKIKKGTSAKIAGINTWVAVNNLELV